MFYYTVESSHWSSYFEFKSKIELKEGQCFRIKAHDGFRQYPTRFKVLTVSENPTYLAGNIVEIREADLNVESF